MHQSQFFSCLIKILLLGMNIGSNFPSQVLILYDTVCISDTAVVLSTAVCKNWKKSNTIGDKRTTIGDNDR